MYCNIMSQCTIQERRKGPRTKQRNIHSRYRNLHESLMGFVNPCLQIYVPWIAGCKTKWKPRVQNFLPQWLGEETNGKSQNHRLDEDGRNLLRSFSQTLFLKAGPSLTDLDHFQTVFEYLQVWRPQTLCTTCSNVPWPFTVKKNKKKCLWSEGTSYVSVCVYWLLSWASLRRIWFCFFYTLASVIYIH